MTDIVERLSGLYDEWNSPHSSPDGLPTGASIMLDAADEITALRAENESLKTAIQRQANAMRTLEYCKKAEINILRQTHQQAHVAAMTLDSEKNANAILTEENERLRAERDRQYDQNAEQVTRIARLRAENERLRKIINSCHWYWDAEDCEECYHDPWDIVNDADDGVICEVWRGGMVETMFVARVGDDCVNEPSMDAAQAKVSELKARAALEGSDD